MPGLKTHGSIPRFIISNIIHIVHSFPTNLDIIISSYFPNNFRYHSQNLEDNMEKSSFFYLLKTPPHL